MENLLNPYIAGAPVVEPSMFFGRQDVFQWIERSLAGKYGHNVLVIHGQRRVGKTSVLKQIPHHLPQKYIQVFFDLQGRTSTSLARFLWWLARDLARTLRQERGLSLPVPDQDAFVQDSEYLHSHFLPSLWPSLGEQVLLLTFDEFDALDQPEIQESLSRPLIEYLGRLFDQERLSFIFSIGSSGHKLENMQAAYTNFFKAALYKKISFLTRDDCYQLIAQPVAGTIAYDPQAIARIYQITAGHPYFTQLMCHELFSFCQKTGKRAIDPGDVEAILEDVIERGTVNLKFVWDEANPLEKWTLACLAQSDGGASNQGLTEMLKSQRVRYSESDLNTALLHLRDKDVLTADNRFVISLLQLWLQRNRPLERVREELFEVNPIANRYIEIGEEYRGLGERAKARDSFQQALAIDPLNLKAQVSLATLSQEQGDFSQALQAYEAALAIDVEDVAARSGFCQANLSLGDQARATQDIDLAAQHYRQVLSINADHSEARQRLAQVYTQKADAALGQGRDEEALSALNEALGFTPEDPALEARLVEVQAEKLNKIIRRALEKSQGQAAAQQWEQAITTLQGALEFAPEDTRIEQVLSEVKAAQRKYILETLAARARGLASAERWEQALAAWKEYLAREPEDAAQAQAAMQGIAARRQLADAYREAQLALEKQDYARAVSSLKQVIMQDETYKDAARLLAQAIEGQRKRRPALHLPKWTGAALVWVALLAGLVYLALRFGPSWVENLAGGSQPRLPATATVAQGTESPAGSQASISATAPPTATAASAGTSQPAWAHGFAGPIVKSFALAPPAFQDDFSGAPHPGWSLSGLSGEKSMQDLTAQGVLNLESAGELSNPEFAAADFAIQFDFLPRSEAFYKFGFLFRGEPDGRRYWVYFQGEKGSNAWNLAKYDPVQNTGLNFAEDPNSPEIIVGQWTQVLLIVKGDQFALILNGKMAAYIQDGQLQGDQSYFHFDEGLKTLDNVKFWSLEPTWLQEVGKFAEPILQSIAGKPPDFEDDFSTQKPEWSDPNLEYVVFPVHDPVHPDEYMVLIPKDGKIATASGAHILATNFVLQYDIVEFWSQPVGQVAFHKLFFGESVNGWGCSFGLAPQVSQQSGNTGYQWDVTDRENQTIAQGNTDSNANITLKIVNREDEYAIYLNDEPLTYFQTSYCSGKNAVSAYIQEGELKLVIDNLKFWSLDRWVADFAEPILQSIADTPPEYEDDFSTKKADWENLPFVEQWLEGGQLVLQNFDNPWVKAIVDQISASDFVIEYEFAVDPGDSDAPWTNFSFRGKHQRGDYGFKLDLSSGCWRVDKLIENPSGNQDEYTLATGCKPGSGFSQFHRFLAMVQGDRFAFYLDGEPLVYIQDNEHPNGYNQILAGASSGNAKIVIDNLKFWSLESHLVKDFTEPILQSIAGQPPDFEDDFSTQKPEWRTLSGVEFLSPENVLRLNACSGFAWAGGALDANDFVLQFDFKLEDKDEVEVLGLRFRSTSDVGSIFRDGYVFDLWRLGGSQDESWTISWEGGDAFLDGPTNAYRAGETNQIMLIVLGDKYAIFLNDSLLVTFTGSDYSGDKNIIRALFDQCAALDIDNLKLWRLEPSPEPTASAVSPQPAWVHEFAEPILQSIADTPPDFEDDFSTRKPEWYPLGPDGAQIVPGEMFLSARADRYREQGGEAIQAHDFVIQYVFQLEYSGQNPVASFLFRGDENCKYEFDIAPPSDAETTAFWAFSEKEQKQISSGSTSLYQHAEWNKVTFVAQGDQFAVFLNDAPLAYFQDILCGIGSYNALALPPSEGKLIMHIDEVSFWELPPAD